MAGAEGATAGAGEKEATFYFDLPECPPEAVMKVTAPDGVMLHIKRPSNVRTGDRICMTRTDGTWGMKHVVRGQVNSAPPAQVSGEPGMRSQADLEADLTGPSALKVKLSTTKGDIHLQICSMWAPLGAQRFVQLVLDGYYTDLAIYRAVPKFLVQFGVVKDPERTEKYQAIKDDALYGVPVTAGTVCFAASGPETRNTTICIFLGDFPQLGKNPWETPIGRVHPDSMDTLRKLHTGYGDMPQCGGNGPDPIALEDQGNEYIREKFPLCDFVTSASWSS
eukprot:TRINITY_DN63328_c1_g1_i1.p1 TRINITY_DN63328_c1_g1~~TRINITY_DN63328_c1_g1_i1.p1  ORF type:complete len:302 (-),score=49.56 TRINITY_DN63328_c1_g1_i1:202-1038(-)